FYRLVAQSTLRSRLAPAIVWTTRARWGRKAGCTMGQQRKNTTLGRREFLLSGAAAAAATSLGAAASAAAEPSAAQQVASPEKRPNLILYLSDQFRWDFVGANGLNSSTHTPNLDALVASGKNFSSAVTNQPVCAPARSVML